jgi:hypothetical protein
MRKQIVMLLITSSALAAPAATRTDPSAAMYTQDGRLNFPDSYREWIYLSSGRDMSYRKSEGRDHSTFDNVFVNPAAYREFMKTGTWPEGTLFVREVRGATETGSINHGTARPDP